MNGRPWSEFLHEASHTHNSSERKVGYNATRKDAAKEEELRGRARACYRQVDRLLLRVRHAAPFSRAAALPPVVAERRERVEEDLASGALVALRVSTLR